MILQRRLLLRNRDEPSTTLQGPSLILQGVLERSIRESMKSLQQPAAEVLHVSILFPTGAPVLLSVICEVWSAATAGPTHKFWVSISLAGVAMRQLRVAPVSSG